MKIKLIVLMAFISMILLGIAAYADTTCPSRSEYFNRRFPSFECNGVNYDKLDMSKVLTLMYDYFADMPNHEKGNDPALRRFFILENGLSLPCVQSGCATKCENAWDNWRTFQQCYPEYLNK